VAGVAAFASSAGTDRVVQRRRAVALARHYREFEGLSTRQIADRLGRSPATIKAYFYDPTGEKARSVKVRYVGVCRGCGAYTQPRNGKGDGYAYSRPATRAQSRGAGPRSAWSMRCSIGVAATAACHPRTTGRGRIRVGVEERRSGASPRGEWRSASIVTRVFGTWVTARGRGRLSPDHVVPAVVDAYHEYVRRGLSETAAFSSGRCGRPARCAARPRAGRPGWSR
jgi:Homeodomain-like domain